MTHDGRWPNRATEDRFWSHVDKSGECWEWTAATRGKGYGQFYIGGDRNMIDAHRYSAMIHLPDFDPALQVCHTCDVKRCVRPSHLFMGTQSDNELDKSSKGRHKWQGKCKRGHDLDVTAVSNGRGITCGLCIKERRAARHV